MFKNCSGEGSLRYAEPEPLSRSPQKPEGLPLLDNIQISLQLEKEETFEKQAIRLRNCGKNFNILMCGCSFIRIAKRCNYRICPYCGKRRSFKFYKQFITILKKKRIARSIFDKGLRFLTLTIKNQKDLGEGLTNLYNSFTKLKRRKYWKNRLKGGLGVIEIKKGKDGLWNHHTHFIIESSFLDMKSHLKTKKDAKLVQEWKICTSGSGVLDIRRIKSHQGALNYVLKYLTKGISELNPEEKGVFFKMTFKRRLLFTFGKGEFYGIKTKKEKAVCPKCGFCYQYLSPNSEEYEIAERSFSENKPPPKNLIYWI